MKNQNKTFQPATFSSERNSIIDSCGTTVPFDDKRIVHIWPIDSSPFLKSLLTSCYKKYNLNFRACGDTNTEILDHARKITSGRECLPFNSIAGSIYKDLKNRDKNEISLYYSVEPDGSCQNSGWPVIFDTFLEREKIKNAIFSVFLNKSTNYFGKGIGLIKDFALTMCLSDIMEEAQSSLKCIAKDRKEALEIFNAASSQIIDAFAYDRKNLNKAIIEWNKTLKAVPLKTTIKKTPKILIFGGLNILFTKRPMLNYFNDSNIIVKCVDIMEGIVWARSFDAVQYAAKNSFDKPEKLLSLSTSISLFLKCFAKKIIKRTDKKNDRSDKEKLKAAYAIIDVTYLEFTYKHYRKKMSDSGLLYDKYIQLSKLASEGNKYISHNAYTESSITVGRYLNSVKSNIFDGLVNIGTFNCQPAMNSIAILRSISNNYDVPFISMDCDGGKLSSNQIRLLESITVQVLRNKT